MDYQRISEQSEGISLGDSVKVGDILDDRYELKELVGRGGCGLVFRATDINLQRDVAVKVLSGEGLNEKDTLHKFEQEGQILRRLHAQNTVFFYDYGETKHHLPYIAMEFVAGTQLKDALKQEGKLSPKRTVSILVQIFSALAEAHGYGFVHRDLKPGNIMLCQRPGFPDDFVKVLDFGIAKIMSEDESIDLNKGDMAGTPKYMPPEQFKNEPLTPKADLYSMGCIAYEMLTGVAPFDGETLHVTVAKQLFMTPKSLDESLDIYPNLEAVVFKLLEKDPDNRFESAQTVIDMLEHWNEPSLVPELKNCRTKGDDNPESSFSDNDQAVASLNLKLIPPSCPTVPLIETPSGLLKTSPQITKPAATSQSTTSRPHDTHKNTSKLVVIIAVSFVIAATIITLIFSLALKKHPTSATKDNIEAAETSANAPSSKHRHIDYILIDTAVPFMVSSYFDAFAYGLQDVETLKTLNATEDDLDLEREEIKPQDSIQAAANSESEAAADEQAETTSETQEETSTAPLDDKDIEDQLEFVFDEDDSEPLETEDAPKTETPRHKHRHTSNKDKKAKTARAAKEDEKDEKSAPVAQTPKAFELFSFTLHYSPQNAKVGFVNAFGQCNKGTCKVRTNSETSPARIVVGAKGYKNKSIILTKKITETTIELERDY